MKNKPLTLSIVIPAYNEERYLKACLDSIANQAVTPDEVMVVDNNSNDKTVAIARSYPFVKVLSESHQHQSFAQAKGFNAARSDIIGRIDADSILPADWVKNAKSYFAEHPDVAGITGGTTGYDIAAKGPSSRIFRLYIDFASWLGGTRMLWGANCALRRRDWLKIKNQVMTRGDIWEDFDISFCLAPLGELRFVDDLEVASSFRAVHKSLITQTRYQFRAVRTFYKRRGWFKAAILFSVWCTMYLLFPLVKLDRHVLVPLSKSLGLRKEQPESL